MEIKINDRVMIKPTNLSEELLLSAINCDFSISHVVTEAHVWGEDRIFLGFEDYARTDVNKSIKGAYDDEKLEKEVIEVLGRSVFGNAMLLPIACVTVISDCKPEVGKTITFIMNDFEDVIIGAMYFEDFGIDIFDGKPRKIKECAEVEDSGKVYFLSLEGVHSNKNDREYTDSFMNIIKENNIKVENLNDILVIFPNQIAQVI